MSVLNLTAEFSVRDGNRTFERVKEFASRRPLMVRRFFISGMPTQDSDSELIILMQEATFSSIRTAEEELDRTFQALTSQHFHIDRMRISVPFNQALRIQDQGRNPEYYWGLSTFSISADKTESLIAFCQAVGLVLLYEPRNFRAYWDQYVWRLSTELGGHPFQAQSVWAGYLSEIIALGAKSMTGQEPACVIKDTNRDEDLDILHRMQKAL